MMRLINTPLFRTVLIASCMLTGDVPFAVPPPQHDKSHSPRTTPTSMKVSSECNRNSYRSAKRRKKGIVDSGATIHCIRDKSLFTHLDTSKSVRVKVADNHVISSMGVGTCEITLKSSDGTPHTILLHNCVYSPLFCDNLISTRRLWRDNRISTHMGGTNYFKCHETRNRYYFEEDCTQDLEPAARRVSTHGNLDLIHARFNHAGERRLRKMFDVTTGLGDPPTGPDSHIHAHKDCPACLEGGMRRKAFAKRRSTVYSYFGERISSDLCGPFPKSVDGFTYALCFVDGYSNYCALYLLKSKSSEEVQQAFEEFLRDHKHHLKHGKQVTWHTDNGGEFMSTDLDSFCREFAVNRSFSVPYAPPQNAQAERMWGLLLKPTRTLLAGARIDDAFWSYTIRHVCQCHNVMPTPMITQHGMITPWEVLTGSKPDVSKFRTWGCLSWYLVPDHEHESKVSPRAWPAVHLGFDPHRNGYIVYIPHKNRITTGYHVVFQEHRFLKVTPTHVTSLPRIPRPVTRPQMLYKEPRDNRTTIPALPAAPDLVTAPPAPHDSPRDRGSDSESDHETRDGAEFDDPNHGNINPRNAERPTRIGTFGPPPPRAARNPNPQYTNVIIDDVTNRSYSIKIDDALSDLPVPKDYDEALKSRLRDRWIASMEKEITDLVKHDTWELVSIDDVPKDRKIVKSRFVYTIKYNRDGTIERFKSRFVACGYSQVKNLDYSETFSATLRSTSFRLLMAVAAGLKLQLDHFDVTSAFTQSEIDAEIYVQPPPGQFATKDAKGRPKILKLKKALYGTKQASKLWQDTLVRHLLKMGFTRLNNDPCMFTLHGHKHTMIVGVYVDDVIVAHNSPELLDWFKREFTGPKGFNSKHLGKLTWFLGMAIDQHSDHSVTIHQSKYIEKLLAKFLPHDTNSARAHTMPCDPEAFQRLTKSRSPEERERVAKLPYLELVGSLLYLSTMTRPDIAYHMSVLCSHMHDPSMDCYTSALNLLSYVGHTRHYHLAYSGSVSAPDGLSHASEISSNHGFVAYSDSSWHKPDELGYNMFGYVVFLHGGPVAFAAKRLKVVALSSAEAEYAAASYACKEVAFVRNVCLELGLNLNGPMCLAVDNTAAITIAANRGVTARTKHFTDAIHYVRHMVDHRIVHLRYVVTTKQLADGFTKPLAKPAFRAWCSRLMGGVGDEYQR